MAKGIKQIKPWAYSEGDLRARIKRFSETPEGSTVFGSGDTDLSNITTKISSSYASHNNLAGDLAIEGTLNVSGNLTVNGTTTTVNSTVTTIDDPIMTLGGDTAPGSDDNKDRGIEFRWHNGSSAKVGFFGFDDSTGNFTFIPDATNSSEVFSGDKGTVDVGELLSAGNISGSGKGYFEKDVEIADDLKVSGSATLGSGATNTFVINSAGRVSGSTKAIFEGDIVTADNLAASGSISAASAAITGNISGSGKGYFEKDVEIADNLKVSGSGTFIGNLSSSGKAYFEKDVEIADNILVTGSATIGSLLSNGNISGSGKGYFEKDVEIADSLLVSGSGAFVGNLSSSGKGYFEKDVEIADSLLVSGSITAGASTLAGKLSSSYAGSNNFEGDLIIEGNLRVSGTTTFGDAAVDLSSFSGKLSSSYVNHNNMVGDLAIEGTLGVSGSATFNQLSASEGMFIPDDKKLWFGTTDTAYIEKDEDGAFDDLKVWTGANGMRLVSTTSDQPNLTIMNINSDANGPKLSLWKYAAGSSADDDIAGTIEYKALNSSDATKTYADIRCNVNDATAGTEDGTLTFSVLEKGSSNSVLALGPNSVTLGTGSAEVVLNGRLSQSYAGGSNVFMDDVVIGNKGSAYYNLSVSGSTTFGSVASNVTTVTGQLSASEGMFIPDDKRLYFGTNNDAYIEYEEDNQDFLVISGSSAGMVLSGTTVQIRGTLQGASPLKIAGGIEIVDSTDGDETLMKFKDGLKLFFGTNDDSFIRYRGATGQYLELSGSSAGTVISGSKLAVTGKMGVGVSVHGSKITHGITLPNTDDVYGKIKANAYTTYSSLRYKDNVEPIQNAMDKIKNLSGVTYNWKVNKSSDIGFIAEDVGKIMPEIVEWEPDGINAQAMDYTKIIPVLVEALKEQQAEIESQKKIINELSEKIDKTKIDKK